MNYIILIISTMIFMGCSTLKKPQNPSTRSYVVKEVTFPSKNKNIKLAGELTMPHGDGNFPAVVLITGSGKQNRDEEVAGHKPFLVLSDYLTKQGFAVLRYDDRGVERSSGVYDSADLYDFADDALGAFEWLQNQPNIDNNKVGLLGHSEGGYIAPVVASLTDDVKFMVFLASPSKALFPDVSVTQLEDLGKARGESTEVIASYKSQYEKLTLILQESQTVEEVKEKIIRLAKEENASDDDIERALKTFANRWALSYAKYNPEILLRQYTNPVLALYGGKDLQVSAKQNAHIMKELLSNEYSDVCIFEHKNHLFQNAKTGMMEEYAEIENTIEIDVLAKISTWLTSVIHSQPIIQCKLKG